MKTQTIAERIAADDRPTRAMICEMLMMTEMEYGEMQYEEGVRYLSTYIEGDDWGQNILLRARIFWNWWKNHWELRDRCFLHLSLQERQSQSTMRAVYAQCNDGEALATNIHPNGVIMNESYAEMIDRLHREILTEKK